MLAYRAALKEISSPKFREGQMMAEDQSIPSPEKRKILLQPSINLIHSEKISEKEILSRTNYDEIKIVNYAFEIYLNCIKKINKNK